MKNVPPRDQPELNRYETFIYDTILQHGKIWVNELQRIVCNTKNQEAMGHPTFLKYLKSLEDKSLVSYLKLHNKKFYSPFYADMNMKYEKIERFAELEYEEIMEIIHANITGIEFLSENPKKQVKIIYYCLLQIFGYQILTKVLRGIKHPEGEENNAINDFVLKLQEMEDFVYMRTSIFLAKPLLFQFDRIIDVSYLNLLKLALWKWTKIEKSSKNGDPHAINIKRLYQEELDENSTELIKRLRKEIKSFSETHKYNKTKF